MAAPKLRLCYHEELNSFVYLERSEANRVIKILKMLPSLRQWTPAQSIADSIDERLPALLSTLHKLAGAKLIDINNKGKIQAIARHPILLLNKQQFNPNTDKHSFLRAAVLVKKPPIR